MEVPEVEKRIGIEVFLTKTRGIGGKLRIYPDDFIVEEIPILPPKDENGEYTIAKIRAKNWETNRLIRQLSKALGIGRERIYFAGTKDKRAVTMQMMAFKASKEKVEGLRLPYVDVVETYRSKDKINIGDLIGNKFLITIRNIALPRDEVKGIVDETLKEILTVKGFPNFFGIQRFGAVRPITHTVGKYIVKGDFEKAVFTYIANPQKHEPRNVFKARAFLEETRDFSKALEKYPKELGFERAIISHLARHSEDYIGALSRLPTNLLMMFTHAYQGYIFNKILSERIRRQLPLNEPILGDLVLPVDKYNLPCQGEWIKVEEQNIEKIKKRVRDGKAFVSAILFGSEVDLADGEQGEIEHKVIEDEGLERDDFIIPQLPKLSSKGMRRELLAPLKDLEYEFILNNLRLRFTLLKGCYATSLLREFMKTDVLNY